MGNSWPELHHGVKQRGEVPRHLVAEVRHRDAAEGRNPLGNVRHKRRLVPLATVRHRRQIRRVGLDEQPIGGDELGDVAQRLGPREA